MTGRVFLVDLEHFLNLHARGFPVDVEGKIKEIGLELEIADDLHENIAGQIERTEDAFKISVSSKLDNKWRRYVMAHELGHYVLHESRIGDGVDDNIAFFSRPGGNFNNPNIQEKQEFEAHVFAALMLAPAKALNDYLDSYREDNSIKTPDEHFMVPAGVLEWWINNLNQVSDESTKTE